MPVLRCTSDGKRGWKWGPNGHCYTGDGAKQKAINQGLAATGGKLEESVMPALLSRFTLHEDVLSRGHNIDTEACIIRNVKVLGKHSRNHTVPNKSEIGQRVYSDEALDQAAKLYEGCEVNIDHPERSNPGRERGFVEGFGVLRNCRREPDGVYADLHYVKSHPLCEMVIERATKFPDKIGLSHNAEGRVAHENGEWVVHSLEMVRSVDLVGKPATTSGLFESVEPLEEPERNEEMTKPKTTKTTLRKVLESAFPEKKAVIQEMEAEELADMSAEMEVPAEAPAEGGGEPDMKSQAKQAFRAMVLAAFDDESLDTKQTIAKIREVLAAQEKLLGGMGGSEGGGESTETTTEMTDDEEKMQESVQPQSPENPEFKALLEKVDRLERENKQSARKQRARELCDEVGVVADSELLESLSLLANDDQMRKLIERMQASPAATPRQRPRSQSPLTESHQPKPKALESDDPNQLAQFLRTGA